MNSNNNWFKNPSLKTLNVFIILSVIGFTLSFLAMSDLFSESVFQGKYLVIWMLIIFNLIVLIKLFKNYKLSRK